MSRNKDLLAKLKKILKRKDIKVAISFALAFGITWGVGLFILTWWIIAFEGATGEVTFIGRLYLGYNISPLGSLIGLGWGLVDGAIGGAIFAWLYNLIAGRRNKQE